MWLSGGDQSSTLNTRGHNAAENGIQATSLAPFSWGLASYSEEGAVILHGGPKAGVSVSRRRLLKFNIDSHFHPVFLHTPWALVPLPHRVPGTDAH